jgi:hypothetical protein
MYQSVNLCYTRNISLTKHLSHINKVSSIYEIYLTIKLYTIFNFIKVCRSNLDSLLYHPQGALSFVSCLFHAITQFEQFFGDGKRRRFHCTILMQNFCKTLWIFENFNIFCIFSFSDPTACYHHGSGWVYNCYIE